MSITRNTPAAIPSQFSGFIRENYPKFVEFLQAYYTFLDSSQTDINTIKDIDEVDDRFIANYRKTFALDVPEFDFLSSRRFILFSRSLYEAKGTEDALRFLYRAAFGKEINIEYPKDWMLRASDGRWRKEYFFDIQVTRGTYNTLKSLIVVGDLGETIYVDPLRVEDQGLNSFRLYVVDKPTFARVGLAVLQEENGEVSFYSKIIPTPSSITILNGGSDWLPGRLISIPAYEGIDALLRVTKTDSNGAILNLEVLEYGFDRLRDHIRHVSPLLVKPKSTTTSTTSVGSAPNVDYTMDVSDSITDIQEYITVNSATKYRSTFEKYPEATSVSYSVTLPEWVQSRARLAINYGAYGSNRGYWETDDGHLSNEGFRLQDSFFYQAFSYLITANVQSEIEDDIIKQTHIAGMKFFKQLDLFSQTSFNMSGSRTRSNDGVNIHDVVLGIIDPINKIVIAQREDSVESVDNVPTMAVAPSPFGDTYALPSDTSSTLDTDPYSVADYAVAGLVQYQITLRIS